MNKQEFKNFCHEEFTKRGFKKRKSMYYLKGKELLCGLYLQKSMAEAYYVEYDFFLEEYNDVKSYPSTYEADIGIRMEVLSKDTFEGEYFMDACIEYELYSEEEIKPYFDRIFERHILPPILEGKKYILANKEFYFKSLFPEEINSVLEKLK